MNVEMKPLPVAQTLVAKPYDNEAILPLSAIRSLTKTDDVPAVTDFMLDLYRSAALTAAQKYTGLLLTGREVITEDVIPPLAHKRTWAIQDHETPYFYITLKYPPRGPSLFWYGLKSQAPMEVRVESGNRRVRLPRTYDRFGINECCKPCSTNGAALGMVQYEAGFDSEASIPAAIKLGALKYIAHVVENPGDVPMVDSITGNAQGNGFRMDVANDPAIASGAVNIWRSVVDSAV
jgi:hypothetical protein